MPRDHAEAIRETFRRWNMGERTLDPEFFVEDVRIESMLTGTSYQAQAGFERWTQEIDELFDRWQIRCDEILDAGPDRAVVLGSIQLRGRESGVELDQPVAYLVEFEDGRVARFTTFASHAEAREAAGLE